MTSHRSQGSAHNILETIASGTRRKNILGARRKTIDNCIYSNGILNLIIGFLTISNSCIVPLKIRF